MKIAVLGATGTAGSRTVAKLKDRDVGVVEVSRSAGVDLISGDGLREALAGADAAIDASNPVPSDHSLGVQEALTAASYNVVEACSAQRVAHLVFLSICGVENQVFDNDDYYLAKRHQEQIVAASSVPSTIVKSTQWHEFATNPSAVTFRDDEVLVKDWLIQPIAADAVADVLVEAALGPVATGVTTRTIAGPQVIRLPELTSQLLERRGDPRPVRTQPLPPSMLTQGALLAPDNAQVLGPDVATWLQGVD